jgi:hypothetical protein
MFREPGSYSAPMKLRNQGQNKTYCEALNENSQAGQNEWAVPRESRCCMNLRRPAPAVDLLAFLRPVLILAMCVLNCQSRMNHSLHCPQAPVSQHVLCFAWLAVPFAWDPPSSPEFFQHSVASPAERRLSRRCHCMTCRCPFSSMYRHTKPIHPAAEGGRVCRGQYRRPCR